MEQRPTELQKNKKGKQNPDLKTNETTALLQAPTIQWHQSTAILFRSWIWWVRHSEGTW